MVDQHRGHRVVVYLGDALNEVVTAKLKKSGMKLSEFVRNAIAAHVDQPELSAVPQGRPKKTAADGTTAAGAPGRKIARKKNGQTVTAPRKAATRKRAAD